MTLWQELRRRQMFRLSGLYIVGVWLALQVADVVFPIWDIPESAKLYLIYAAILCAPIALVFGWVFDVTKEGIFRTKRAGPDEIVDLKLERTDYAILVALIAVGIVVLLGSAEKIQEQVEDAPAVAAVELRPNSVAVLPFENLDNNPETGYFSDGITEEILTRLSSLGGLHVTSRNSSFMFRNSAAGPAEITNQLGVRYLLSGSVRRDNNLVRITARLVDFQGFQVWAASFDRDFSEILNLQAEIATTVSGQISTEITQTSVGGKGEKAINPEAYDAYLFARALLHARTENWVEQAAEVLEKAIRLEPDYAPPHALLSIVKAFAGYFTENTDEVQRLAHRALELDPNLAEAHLAIGFLYLNDENQRAIESFRRSLELDPSLTMAYSWLASALEQANRIDEMFAVQRQGLAVDPLNPILVLNVAIRHFERGEQQQAERLYLRLVNAPQPAANVGFALHVFYYRVGRFDEAIRWLRHFAIAGRGNVSDVSDSDIAGYVREVAYAYLRIGKFGEATDWSALADSYDPNRIASDTFAFSSRIMQGQTAEAAEIVNAVAASLGPQASTLDADIRSGLGLRHIIVGQYEQGIKLLEPEISFDVLDAGRRYGQKISTLEHILHLAFAYRQTGRSEDAIELLKKTETVLERLIAEGAHEIPDIYTSLALAQGLLGDGAAARTSLARAIELGWIDYHFAIHSDMWAQAFQDNDLRLLLSGVKDEVDRQSAVVTAADAATDFRTEMEEILASREPRQ